MVKGDGNNTVLHRVFGPQKLTLYGITTEADPTGPETF